MTRSGVLLPVAAALLGGLAYTVAFAFVERRSGQAANFYFYSTAGGLLTLAACVWMLREPVLILSGLALAAAWFGYRYDRQTLRYHSVAYLLAGASSSRLLSLGMGHLLGRGLAGVGLPPVPAWVALGAMLATYAVLAPVGEGTSARARIPQTIVAALVVVGLDAALAGTAGRGHGRRGVGPDARDASHRCAGGALPRCRRERAAADRCVRWSGSSIPCWPWADSSS